MIKYARDTGRCKKLIIGTNASLFPYKYINLHKKELYIKKSAENIASLIVSYELPVTLKPSINYHLIKADKFHLDKCSAIKEAFDALKAKGDYNLVFNVRRRKVPLSEDNDQWLVEEIQKRNLEDCSNIFFYQKYGLASERDELEEPFIIKNPVEFYLIDPLGRNFGMDMLGRSKAMKDLP